ncbi:hypothetical protein VIBHAR_07123 [Vibrio campbellii ATCC BAA-1116]|uniref:Uncharacterized protein n=1 Tax=Vibrio campbellii (strain ATCC BAA-1116) TaxID=2902295 RepID=A7N7K5_VIBC1|nr:hypothetical protein VIBHAR_07123 [Vibrio campbellii ATCC BAA-1116]
MRQSSGEKMWGSLSIKAVLHCTYVADDPTKHHPLF